MSERTLGPVTYGRPCDGLFYMALYGWWRKPDIRFSAHWHRPRVHDTRTGDPYHKWNSKHFRRWIVFGFGYIGYNFGETGNK